MTFHGWVDAETMARELPSHHLLFLCSRFEGLPIVLPEAMLCGMACVVPALQAGLRYLIGQGGGWEQSVPELGQKFHFFEKRGIKLELLYTQGSGETQQPVVAGSVDVDKLGRILVPPSLRAHASLAAADEMITSATRKENLRMRGASSSSTHNPSRRHALTPADL